MDPPKEEWGFTDATSNSGGNWPYPPETLRPRTANHATQDIAARLRKRVYIGALDSLTIGILLPLDYDHLGRLAQGSWKPKHRFRTRELSPKRRPIRPADVPGFRSVK